jgi:hypothetical protein
MGRIHFSSRRLQRQRGGTAIMFALVLPVLLGFAALAVDLARIHLVKVELQNAADAASLGGARSLSDPGGQPYNWSAAATKALDVARSNVANGAQIQDAQIETGYWNILNPSPGFRPAGTGGAPIAGDVPAVRVTTAISKTRNNGPLQLLFAPILGISDSDVQASAIAVIAPPTGGTGMFPMAITGCMFNLFWDSDTNSPRLDPDTNEPYLLDISSIYSGGCTSGQWTTYTTDANNVPIVRDLIEFGNTTAVNIGDRIWIQPGVKATLYDTVEALSVGRDVAVPVVANVETHSQQPVVAIAGFHIESVQKHGNKSYVTGHFINPKTIPGLTPGTGNGVQYGALTPPILVK